MDSSPAHWAMRDLRATRYLAISTREAMPLDLRRRMDRGGAARSPTNFDDRMIRGRDNRSVALFSYWALWVSEDDVTVYAYKMKHQARFGTGVMPGTG